MPDPSKNHLEDRIADLEAQLADVQAKLNDLTVYIDSTEGWDEYFAWREAGCPGLEGESEDYD